MRKYLISVCGPNGSGKSTFTRTILFRLNLPVVDADQISSQGISEIAAGKAAVRLINSYLDLGVSFIKESTLSSKFDLKIIRRAKELGYKNILIYLALPSPKIAVQRVARRVRNGGHDIPIETIYRRFERGLANLKLIRDQVDKCEIVSNFCCYP